MFVPPIVLGLIGLALVLQPNAFGAKHELIAEQVTKRSEASVPTKVLAFSSFDTNRLGTDLAGSDLVLVNKQRPLNPLDYQPTNLRKIETSDSLDNSRGLELSDQAASALEKLAKGMKAEGAGKLFVNSAFRSFDYQQDLFKSKTKQYGLAGALIRSAKAGHSEHQTGLAVDVSVPAQGCAIMQCFGDTVGGKWLAANAWRYGFIIRYEEDTTKVTGYTYEPWHLRFVGKQAAKLYTDLGIQTLEEFWGYPAAEFYLEEIAESTND